VLARCQDNSSFKPFGSGLVVRCNEDADHNTGLSNDFGTLRFAMTLLYWDPRFLDHDTGQHPECAERLRQVIGHLEARGLGDSSQGQTGQRQAGQGQTGQGGQTVRPTWQPASEQQLARVHPASHVATLQALAERGGGRADADTVVSPASVDVARLAAGALCDAVGRVLAGEEKRALCLVRPPGHHALSERAMGFCLFNHIAVAAAAALVGGIERVLIVDWDVHHGNGTQAIFYDDPRVGFFSVHRWPFYPGTGEADETGTGDGLGTTRNVPVPFGISRADYQSRVRRELEDFAARIKPELVLVSAGFDSHREDPIGSLGLEVEDFVWLTAAAKQIAVTYADGRLVSTLEGGYNPPVLADCVAVHWLELLSR